MRPGLHPAVQHWQVTHSFPGYASRHPRYRRQHPAGTGTPTPQRNTPTPRRLPLLPFPQTGLPDSNLHKEKGFQVKLSHFRPTRRLPGSVSDTTQQRPQATNNQHSQLLQQAPEPQLENPRPTNTLTRRTFSRNFHPCRPGRR